MGFDAGTIVEPLDWDFTRFDAGKGTIPEPSDKAIDTLFKDLSGMSKNVLEQVGITDSDTSPEELLIALADLPEDATIGIADVMKQMAKIFAKLCKNQPSEAQLLKLPLRIRMRFFVWLAGELRPEDFGAATTNRAPGNGQLLQLPPMRTVKGA